MRQYFLTTVWTPCVTLHLTPLTYRAPSSNLGYTHPKVQQDHVCTGVCVWSHPDNKPNSVMIQQMRSRPLFTLNKHRVGLEGKQIEQEGLYHHRFIWKTLIIDSLLHKIKDKRALVNNQVYCQQNPGLVAVIYDTCYIQNGRLTRFQGKEGNMGGSALSNSQPQPCRQ